MTCILFYNDKGDNLRIVNFSGEVIIVQVFLHVGAYKYLPRFVSIQ